MAAVGSRRERLAAGGAVVAGQTYMLRLAGNNAQGDVRITNHVPDVDRLDISRDGRVSLTDALRIINALLAKGSRATPLEGGNPDLYLDTNLDGRISLLDAVQLINYLLSRPQSAAPASAVPLAVPATTTSGSGEADAMAFSLTVSAANPATDSPSNSAAPLDAVYAEIAAAVDDEPGPLMVAPSSSVASSPAWEAANTSASDAALADDPDWDFLS